MRANLVSVVDDMPGTKGYEVAAWTGLFAPRGTPRAVREEISADVLEALRLSDVMERYSGFGYEPFDAGPDAYAHAIRRETVLWADVIRAAKLKLDYRSYRMKRPVRQAPFFNRGDQR